MNPGWISAVGRVMAYASQFSTPLLEVTVNERSPRVVLVLPFHA